MTELIIERLKSLGYEVKEDDSWLIGFCTEKVENHIKSTCNVTLVPDELKNAEVDRICGEFLFSMKQIGKLDAQFNLEAAVKSVQTGDTNISFDVGDSTEKRMNVLLHYLMTRGDGDFVCCRKVRW